MLQSLEVWHGLCDPSVGDTRAVAERQTGQAAAVPGHRRQAGVGDRWQHGQRQMVEIWVTHHLGDAAVGEFGAGSEVQLLQPAQSEEGRSLLLLELLQVVLRHQFGSLLKRRTRRLEEAHVAKCPGELGTFVSRLLVKLTLICVHHSQQTPVRHLFAPTQPQNYQLLQVGGDSTDRYVSHIEAGGEIQLTESVSQKLSE